jgi:hypothetical protein
MPSTFGGLVYLYYGGEHPEIRSVNSREEALLYAEKAVEARLEVPGQEPESLKSKEKIVPANKSADDTPYNWRVVRGHLQNGESSITFDLATEFFD